ncbi:MAG: cobalamin biosynthesis protein CobW [Clostridia bacterium]|nr:cobalamin biosynthesis protein CobW [Clostridia bacterium]
MTKIDIFSGFLGAGKTTLIKKLMEEAYTGEKLVLIENEFGEIGIDGGFLQEAGVEITEMNSGCICCSLVGDFGKALEQVVETYHPDRVLIEPSGVGKLSDVITAVTNLEIPDVELNSFTTVADAGKCKIYAKNFGEFYDNQLEHAACIILSRTQNLSPEKLAAAVELIQGKNPHATVIATPWDQLTGKQILDAMEQKDSLEEILHELTHEHHHHEHHHHDDDCDCGCHDHDHVHEHEHHHHEHDHHEEDHHDHGPDCTCGCHDHHHHHADEVFTSWGKETTRTYTADQLTAILEELDLGKFGTVLRAKGMVADGEGGWLFFDYVPGEQEVRKGTPQVIGRLCVIGSELQEDALAALFGLEG